MLDSDEYSRILDVLGNRNRRRILSLLRQKPCFVTELSERLTLSPKALIEHLALMEQMEILGSYLDDRRRKYYYLTRDITVEVSFGGEGEVKARPVPVQTPGWQSTLTLVRKMIRARGELITNLEQLDQDIQQKITDLARQGGDLISGEELDVILALSQADLTLDELREYMDLERSAVQGLLAGLMEKGIVERKGARYSLRGIDDT